MIEIKKDSKTIVPDFVLFLKIASIDCIIAWVAKDVPTFRLFQNVNFVIYDNHNDKYVSYGNLQFWTYIGRDVYTKELVLKLFSRGPFEKEPRR